MEKEAEVGKMSAEVVKNPVTDVGLIAVEISELPVGPDIDVAFDNGKGAG